MNGLPKWQDYKENREKGTAPDPIPCDTHACRSVGLSKAKVFLLRWEVLPGKAINMLEHAQRQDVAESSLEREEGCNCCGSSEPFTYLM